MRIVKFEYVDECISLTQNNEVKRRFAYLTQYKTEFLAYQNIGKKIFEFIKIFEVAFI